MSKTFQNHPYGQPVLTFDKRQICRASWQAFEWTVIELRFLLCVNLKAFDTRGILSTPAYDVHLRLKTTGTAIKIAKETTNNQDKKCHSVKHL